MKPNTADKLRVLLATRPPIPEQVELVRWWRVGAGLVTRVLEHLDCACEIALRAADAANYHKHHGDREFIDAIRSRLEPVPPAQLDEHGMQDLPAPGPLDEMAQNLMAELHAMKFEGAPIGMGLRLDRLLDKVHALAVVTADTRIRLLAMERRFGRHA